MSGERDGDLDRELGRNVLYGAIPVDAAVGRAVDAALRRGSVDRTLHAAALWIASSAGADLGLHRSPAKRWMLGLDELVNAGRLDTAADAAHRINAAFPGTPYLEFMALAFQRMPPKVDGRQPFVDNLEQDVQVVAMPGSRSVVLAFCGNRHRLGLSLNLVDRWFGQLGSHVVYLRDRRRVGYIGGIPTFGRDLASTTRGIARLVRNLGARRVACTGTSSGASGALHVGLALGADRVLALAPITGGPQFEEMVAPSLPPSSVMPWTDLVSLYRDGAGGVRARIMYAEKHEGDREQSLLMAGLPDVTVEAIPDLDTHHLVSGLIRVGRFEQVLGWLTADDPDPCPGTRHSLTTESILT